MASAQHVLLSPAELSYLHTSLSLTPPIRPDGRTANQFRPLIAETGVLPGANGSARICFADGTEAIVGVKAEVEKSKGTYDEELRIFGDDAPPADDLDKGEIVEGENDGHAKGEMDWVDLTIEIPGLRDDDAVTVFLAATLAEALLADGELVKRLYINRGFHWRLYIDILLISPPLSYPLPLLSLTVHLGLLATRLPRLKSEGDEDPLFDDDWAASTFLFPQKNSNFGARPPISLLVMGIGENIIFDPSKEELAVADVALVVSVGEAGQQTHRKSRDSMDVDEAGSKGRGLRLLSVRTIDPPSRLTPLGVPNAAMAGLGVSSVPTKQQGLSTAEGEDVDGVWKPPRGGVKMQVLAGLLQRVLQRNGIADEALDALAAVDLV